MKHTIILLLILLNSISSFADGDNVPGFRISPRTVQNDGGKGTIGLYCTDKLGKTVTWSEENVEQKIMFDICVGEVSEMRSQKRRIDSGATAPKAPEVDPNGKSLEEINKAYQKLYCEDVLKAAK